MVGMREVFTWPMGSSEILVRSGSTSENTSTDFCSESIERQAVAAENKRTWSVSEKKAAVGVRGVPNYFATS